jgi:hypothetical protein
VRKVENRVLTGSPLAMSIGNWRVLGQHAGHRPVEQVRVVGKSLSMERMVVQADGAVVAETLAECPHDKVGDPDVGETTTGVKVLDWQLSDESKAQEAADLSSGGVVGPVKVRLVDGSCDLLHFATREPASEDGELAFGFRRPGRHDLLEVMFGHTKADEVVILDVLCFLRVNFSALHIIVGIL